MPEAYHSPPPSAEVRNEWNYTTTPIHVFMAYKGINLLSHGVGRWRPSWGLNLHSEFALLPLKSQCETVTLRVSENRVLRKTFGPKRYDVTGEWRIIIIIIIIFINCNWVDTRWQWLFYMYTKYDIGYY
jgi:hypothetical protein